MLVLDSGIKVITFDCYGTLVQWHDAVRRAAASILERRLTASVSKESIAGFAARLRQIAMEHQQQLPFRDYELLLETSLKQALREAGHDATAEDFETLFATLEKIEPHPDVPEALARLREHYQIAVISNTSDSLIAETILAIGTPIDFVITAERARAYKPDHELFHYAHAVMSVSKDETVHVAMGQFSDLKVCEELDIRSVWIDREGDPLNPAWQPDAVLKDLTGLPQLLIRS